VGNEISREQDRYRAARFGRPAGNRGRGWALLATSLGFGVVQLDVSVVNVAIKPIGAELGGSIAGLQWVVNAYTLAFAALILSAGALGDRIGAKRVFLAGFVLFTLASAACGLAPGLGVLIAARAVQGTGAAVLVPCSLTLLSHAYALADGVIAEQGTHESLLSTDATYARLFKLQASGYQTRQEVGA
jgi:DHA2 family methylenomycin A resistance protein-like MFS transporter